MAGLDNSRYGAAATAAPVLTASARPRRRRVKVFSQVFFKKLAGCGTASHGPKGVARVLVPGGHRLGPTEPAGETRKPLPSHTQKKGGRMSPSWDSTKAVAPEPKRSKGSSIEKSQVLCGFQNLTQGSRVPHSCPCFPALLTLGTSLKNPGFMRVLATLDPLEYSSGPCAGKRGLSPSLTITTDGKVFLTQKKG